MFRIELATHAQRFIGKCDSVLYARLMEKIKLLSEEPFPQGTKRVVGRHEKVFRLRVGDYRIMYVVFHEQGLVLITDIDKRGRVYE